MKTQLRYEKPYLISFTDDRSCQGASCSGGSFINDGFCLAGSCYGLSSCDTGTRARACGAGSNACNGDAYFSCCVYGGGVTSTQGMMTIWYCEGGGRACDTCQNYGSQAMWCGGGSSPV